MAADPLRTLRALARHLEESLDHTVPIADWITLLRLCFPNHYAEPPPSPTPAAVLKRAARVAVLRNRKAARVALWNPEDLVCMETVDVQVGPLASQEQSGAVESRGRLVDSSSYNPTLTVTPRTMRSS